MSSASAAGASGPAPARLAAALLAGLLLLASGSPARAQEDDAPEASWLAKIAWSAGPGLTRLRFHARWSIRPEIVRTSPNRLRIDLRGVGAGDTPQRLQVGTPEVAAVQRIPEAARGFLPPGVSERFLVELANPQAAWNFEATDDGFQVLIGDAELTGEPVALPSGAALSDMIVVDDGPRRIEPEPGEYLPGPVPFRSAADLPVRAGPSALHSEIGRLREEQVSVADARRGAWLHLRAGGWVRHALGAARADAGRGTELRQRRTPVSWSVVTLVPVLNLQVEEVLPGRDPQADVVASYFAEPVRLARLTVLATGKSAFSFRFPPRADRLRLEMKDGSRMGSLDPMALPRRAGVTLDELEESFPSPQISTGEGFSGYLVLPGDLDFRDVADARVDVAGRLHRLFRVPGSGEIVEE